VLNIGDIGTMELESDGANCLFQTRDSHPISPFAVTVARADQFVAKCFA
jgi:hypothetical protein